jgi:hypothetical protein
VVQSLKTAPSALVKSTESLRIRPPGAPVDGRLSDSASTVYTRTAPDLLDRIRETRDLCFSGVSIMSLITLAVARSLRAQGIETEDCADVIVDLRRYLPPGKGTLANFVAVAPIPIGNACDVFRFAKALEQYTSGYGILTRHVASSLFSYMRSISPEFGRFSTRRSRAKLSVSDMSARDEMQKIAWKPGGDRVFVIKLVPNYSNQIAIAVARIESELHVTAAFYESHFDPKVVQSALDNFGNELADLVGMQR